MLFSVTFVVVVVVRYVIPCTKKVLKQTVLKRCELLLVYLSVTTWTFAVFAS